MTKYIVRGMDMKKLGMAVILLATAGCAPAYYAACPGADLHRCEGLNKDTPFVRGSHPGSVYDADGIKDKDLGPPTFGKPAKDGHGTWNRRGSDPDEKGDNGGTGEH